MISLGQFLQVQDLSFLYKTFLYKTCFETIKVVEAIKSRGTHFGFDSPRMSRAESTKKPTEFTYHPAPTEIKNKIDAHIYENSGLQSISDVKFNSDDD